MKKIFIAAFALALVMTACGNNEKKSDSNDEISSEFVVDSADAVVEEPAVVTDDEKEEVKVTTSAASENWDEVLDEYEDFCNKTVQLAKKAQSGDMSVMTEYASLAEQAQELNEKLENAKDELSAAQVARLNKIASKMASSMM